MDLSTGGPDSFALAPVQMPTAGPDATYRPLSAGVRGGNVAAASMGAGIDIGSFQRTSMLDGLLALGQKTLAPKIEQQRKVMALDGAVAAMQGTTAAELAKGDLFQGFFGDPVAVAAARQVESVNQVSAALTDIQSSMGEWKKKTPNEFRAMLPDVMKKHFTGDDLSDSIIAQSFIQQMPGIVEMHTKESIKYQNEVALTTYSNRARGALQMYQGFADAHQRDSNTTTKDMLQAAEVNLLDELGSTLAVMDEKTIGKVTFSLAREMAKSGSFAALSALERSPILGMLSPEQQAAMPKILVDAKNEYMLTNPKFADLYSTAAHFETAVSQAAVSEDKIREAAVKFSATGLKGYDNEWVKAQIKNLQAAKLREAKASKDDKASTGLSSLASAVANGQNWELDHTISPKDKQRIVDEQYMALATNPKAQQQMLSDLARSNAPYPTALRMSMSGALRTVMSGGQFTPGGNEADLSQAYALWRTNPQLAIKQYGESSDEVKVLTLLDTQPGVFSPDPKIAKQTREAFGAMLKSTKDRPAPSAEQTRKEVASALSMPWFEFTDSQAARADEERQVAIKAESLVKSTGLPAEKAVEIVRNSRKTSEDRVAGVAALGNPGQGPIFTRAVLEVVAGNYGKSHGEHVLNPATFDKVTKDELNAQAKVKFNKTVDIGDVHSVVYDTAKNLRVTAYIDGLPHAFTITAAAVGARYSEAIAVRTEDKSKRILPQRPVPRPLQ